MSTMIQVTEPTMVLNEEVCKRNIARMAAKAKAANVVFRPHFKTQRADERITHGVMESHQIQKRRDEPRSKLFGNAASEDEHFAQVYGRHATEQFHCALPETLRPVMLRNASSRLTLLTVLDSCSRVAVSAASLRLLK